MAVPRRGPPIYLDDLGELEAEVMDQLWANSPATVRDVLEAINHRHRRPGRAYTTVLTTMVRLADDKGLLRRTRRGNTDFYAPTLERGDYQQRRAQRRVGAVMDEFGDLALVHFAQQMAKLDPARREELARLAGLADREG
jgi:predicted transcriptional regulator